MQHGLAKVLPQQTNSITIYLWQIAVDLDSRHPRLNEDLQRAKQPTNATLGLSLRHC